ncbi:MAG: DUF5348 domain-containing protein [Fusobacterium necrophorum]|nr:DUF5348 domain-containing protein [Fusobacterium necrophorum]
MLDKDFKNIKNEMDYLHELIDKATDNYNRRGFENNQVYDRLERFLGSLETVSEFISHMNKEFIEGYLIKSENGIFELPEADYTLTCGSRIEVFVSPYDGEEKKWCNGRVEHDSDSYYFCNCDGEDADLKEGMKVRIRF